MAEAEVTLGATPESAVERNIALNGRLMRYLLAKPQVFGALPNDFELIILPDDDPEMRQYNLELLDRYSGQDKPLVFVRLQSSQVTDLEQTQPNLYVPLAA